MDAFSGEFDDESGSYEIEQIGARYRVTWWDEHGRVEDERWYASLRDAKDAVTWTECGR